MGDKRENKQWMSRNVFVTSLQMVMKMYFEIESTFVVSLNTLKKNNVLNSRFLIVGTSCNRANLLGVFVLLADPGKARGCSTNSLMIH